MYHNDNMYVDKKLLLENSSKVITFTVDELNEFKLKLGNFPKKSGSSSILFFDENVAHKKYIKEPILKDNCGWPIFHGKRVVQNLFNLLNITNEKSASPEVIYVCNERLVGYKSNTILGFDNLNCINKNNNDMLLENLRSSWNEALGLARFYASYNIIMYDLYENNAFIKNGTFKICDLDFFSYEPNNNEVLSLNYDIVNTMFINFIERYLFKENYNCRYDKYLIKTDKYVDEAIEDLLLASSYGCKTLKEVALNL